MLGAVKVPAALTDPFRCVCAMDAFSFGLRKLNYKTIFWCSATFLKVGSYFISTGN